MAKVTGPLEKDIEETVCDHAKKLGCLVYKFTSPSRRSVPDRIFIMPGARGVFFIEFKRKGNVATAGQEVEIAKIRKQGISVFVVDEKQKGKSVVEDMIASAGGAVPVTKDRNGWKVVPIFVNGKKVATGRIGPLVLPPVSTNVEDY